MLARIHAAGSAAALTVAAALPSSAQQMGTAPHPVVAPGGTAVMPLDDIRFLSAGKLAGRLTGSPGADTAAAYLARRFRAVGLQPAAGGWFQSFTVARDAPVAQHAHVAGLTGNNVIGLLPGRDPVLRNEAIIVGAHYDHLGLGGFGSLDPDSTGKVHNGADDNASGAAMLIEIAQRLAAAPPARTVVFIAFSGEELGLLGSSYYVKKPIYPLATTLAMINLDMVGRLRQKRLIVYGSRTAKEFPALLDSLNWYAGLRPQGARATATARATSRPSTRPGRRCCTSSPICTRTITVPPTTGRRSTSTGSARWPTFVTGVVTALANRPGPLTAGHRHAAGSDPERDGATPGYGAYLGTVPDMTDSPGGVRLLGVRAGSPAEKAGLRGDDIITRIGDMNVPDLQAMTDALRSHQPGDTVDIVVRRGDATTTLRATLGHRGG